MKRFAVLPSGGDAPGVRRVAVNWPADMAQLTRQPDIVATEHLQYALARVDCDLPGIARTPACLRTGRMAGAGMAKPLLFSRLHRTMMLQDREEER